MGHPDYRINVERLKAEYAKRRWNKQTLADNAQISVESLRKVERTGFATSRIAGALSTALELPLGEFAEPTGIVPTLAKPAADDGPLDEPAIRAKLRAGRFGSANGCAFLAGDFSVLTTKRAFLFPVDARMHVSLNPRPPDPNDFRVTMYYPKGRALWAADVDAGRHTAENLRKALSRTIAAERYPHLAGIDATVVSELPPHFAVYEETAIALALARAIMGTDRAKSPIHAFETLRLAALLLTGWYDDVTWATLVASSLDPHKFEGVVSFDRRNDGGIDLVGLYESSASEDGAPAADFERNIYPDAQFWKERKGFSFDRNMVSIWWHDDKLVAKLEARERFQGYKLREVDVEYVIDRMEAALKHFNEDKYRKIGLLMQLHQLELDAAQLVDREPQELINDVNDLPDVRGAKLACWRGTGAIVVLMDPASDQKRGHTDLKKLGLRHLDECAQRVDMSAP
jgi:mevalonate kinase